MAYNFVLADGARRVELLGSDIAGWRITPADTGLETTIAGAQRRVRHILAGEEIFLANWGETLTDAPLDRLVERFGPRPPPPRYSRCAKSNQFRVLRRAGVTRA